MKNKIIIGVVVLIVIGAGAWYFASRGGNVAAPNANTAGNTVAEQTMAGLLAAGKPVKCTITPSADNENMSGTFYVANGKVRGDYSVNAAGQNMSGHMIALGSTSYTWLEGQTTGFKMTALANEKTNANAGTPAASQQGFDASLKMNYHCGVWSADPSVFALPANVKFTDFNAGAMMPPTTAGGSVKTNAPAGNAAECAACDQVPASYRAQCKSALGCK
jgi:hypothetical protein